jgi:hypothetical protein
LRGGVLTKTSIAFSVLLLAAVVLNGYLLFAKFNLETDLRFCKESEKHLVEQREILLDLIPAIGPHVTKSQLAKVIKAKYPSEPVDELENLVGWRLFKFWFDKDGRLELVQYSS